MDWSSFVNVVVSLICIVCSVAECGPLNDYILDYQPLNYDRNAVHRNHQRVRRSVDTHLYVRFSAFGRNFQLKLSPSEGIFGRDHQVYSDDKGFHSVDTSFIYQGQVKGEPRSTVHLAVHNGSLEGHVEMPETTYHIEPAAKYIKDPSFHTIIYPETHLNTDPYRAHRMAEAGMCGLDHHHIHEFMEQASRLQEEPSNVWNKRSTWEEREHMPHNIYSEYSNRERRAATGEAAPSRHKRSLGSVNACPLHMRADPLLYNFFRNTKHGTDIGDKQAEEEVLAFFSNHVNAISTIYSKTVFETYDGNLQNTGLSFVIHRSTVMKDCNQRDNDYCSNTVDVSNYLDLTSKEDHDLFCLVFTFTYRDFSGGTLGLAWVATESNVQSGVCGRYSTYTGGSKKSLNTGIVTIINFGKTVPNRVSQLTFAHEAGHNFGSPHDMGSAECAPFGTSRSDANNGNYIMFPSATSGDKVNNDQFSKCSRDNMTRIIQQVVDGSRNQCFTESGQAFCGNKITEGDEECDCGFGTCLNTTCCEGRDVAVADSGCKLVASATCSPDSGPCCTDTCTFKSADSEVCQDESECKMQAKCNGSSFKCPEPAHKLNGTYCNHYSKVCSSGECLGPVCSNINDAAGTWEECFQTSDTAQDSELCFVACKHPTSGECVSSANENALADTVNAPFKTMLMDAANQKLSRTPTDKELPIMLPAGSACDNFRGYCDTFSKCQRIDSQGPFNQLTNMIFDPVTLNKVKDWIVAHWWAVLLMVVGLVVFMGVFIKVFGYNTPSQDPKRQRQQQARQQPPRGQPRQQGRGAAMAKPTTPPPYTTGMDMAHYNQGYQQRNLHQFDRLAPGYGKNHI